jgi:hypothetical protein
MRLSDVIATSRTSSNLLLDLGIGFTSQNSPEAARALNL